MAKKHTRINLTKSIDGFKNHLVVMTEDLFKVFSPRLGGSILEQTYSICIKD